MPSQLAYLELSRRHSSGSVPFTRAATGVHVRSRLGRRLPLQLERGAPRRVAPVPTRSAFYASAVYCHQLPERSSRLVRATAVARVPASTRAHLRSSRSCHRLPPRLRSGQPSADLGRAPARLRDLHARAIPHPAAPPRTLVFNGPGPDAANRESALRVPIASARVVVSQEQRLGCGPQRDDSDRRRPKRRARCKFCDLLVRPRWQPEACTTSSLQRLQVSACAIQRRAPETRASTPSEPEKVIRAAHANMRA